MATAIKIGTSIGLSLTQDEANYLCALLQNHLVHVSQCSSDFDTDEVIADDEHMAHTIYRERIFNALLPITQAVPT